MFRIFSKNNKEAKEEKILAWQEITEEKELEEILKASFDRPVFIFKHSTRCGISAMALSRLTSDLEPDDDYGMYILDLLSYRSISNLIAEKLQVLHQSPQLIVLRNGEVVHQSSHSAIKAKVIADFI